MADHTVRLLKQFCLVNFYDICICIEVDAINAPVAGLVAHTVGRFQWIHSEEILEVPD